MTHNQLFSLSKFFFNFHKDSDISLHGVSPGYITEKWNIYIGTGVVNFKYDLNDPYLAPWKETWNVTDEEILTIYQFILDMNKKDVHKTRLSTLISLIKSLIDVNKISESSYNGLHPMLKDNLDRWLKTKENQRLLKLSLVL
jgi:hypothetical protein